MYTIVAREANDKIGDRCRHAHSGAHMSRRSLLIAVTHIVVTVTGYIGNGNAHCWRTSYKTIAVVAKHHFDNRIPCIAHDLRISEEQFRTVSAPPAPANGSKSVSAKMSIERTVI